MFIEIDEIAKSFGTTAALQPVSLAIPSGALVALLGPSGSGKTTLLRILGGLEFPSSGRVSFDGKDATGLSVQERRAGFVFQSYNLLPSLTVYDNVALPLRLRRDRRVRTRVMAALEAVGLHDRQGARPVRLSGAGRALSVVDRDQKASEHADQQQNDDQRKRYAEKPENDGHLGVPVSVAVAMQTTKQKMRSQLP